MRRAKSTACFRRSFLSAALGLVAVAALVTAAGMSCQGEPDEAEGPVVEAYRADFVGLNNEITGMSPSGTALIETTEDSVTIRVTATGLPPGMMHLMHIHGFSGDTAATCATMAQDINNDSIVDLMETEIVSGITLIPFHDDPVSMQIQAETYPRADSAGVLSYARTIARPALDSALEAAHGITDLELENRVIYIHGAPEGTSLPETVQSLPEVPAQITLPIACGDIDSAGAAEVVMSEE